MWSKLRGWLSVVWRRNKPIAEREAEHAKEQAKREAVEAAYREMERRLKAKRP